MDAPPPSLPLTLLLLILCKVHLLVHTVAVAVQKALIVDGGPSARGSKPLECKTRLGREFGAFSEEGRGARAYNALRL